ncbi:MAG: DapH/DapD/GlmU-related protein [Planctomycetota bacterium]
MDTKPAPVRDPMDKQLGPEPWIHPTARVSDCTIGAWTEIGERVELVACRIGDYSYIAGSDGSLIWTDVGRFTSIASHVRINPGDHPMQRPTQHHCTYRARQYGFAAKDDTDFFAWRAEQRCHIGHDVWIGHGAIVMPGIRIGIGAVVGAGAVVTHDVPDYGIVVGSPARLLRYRFAEGTRERLLATAWWDWDRATLEDRFADLSDLDRFLVRYAPG